MPDTNEPFSIRALLEFGQRIRDMRIGQIDPSDNSGNKIGVCGSFDEVPGFAEIIPGLHKDGSRNAVSLQSRARRSPGSNLRLSGSKGPLNQP